MADSWKRAKAAAEQAELNRQRVQKEQESAREIMAQWDRIEQAISEFERLKSAQSYVRHRQVEQWLESHRALAGSLKGGHGHSSLDPCNLSTVQTLIHYSDNAEQLVREANQAFTVAQYEKYRPLFDSIESHPLNNDQREAIIHDEDSNLVVAGAGTGKTSSIVGKVAFLLSSGAAKPDQILLLAFTRKAAEEMSGRLDSRIGPSAAGLSVRTFHGFGLEIIAQVRGEKPSLAFDDKEGGQYRVLADAFDRCSQDEEYARRAVEYFAYFLQPVVTAQSFDSPGESYRYLKSQRPLYLKGERLAMRGEDLRSFDEVDIANFLFTHGVEYEYETEYRVRTASKDHRQYTPDFYLPAYDIYIEHFAVNRNGEVPDWFSSRNGKSASQAYTDDMTWKRQLHRENKTKLIETFAYEKKEGVLLENLEKRLLEHGVVLCERSSIELIRELKTHAQKPVPLFIKFMATFLELAKSNGFVMADLRRNVARLGNQSRATAFLDLFEPISDAYEAYLRTRGVIDFSDMIAMATAHIRNREYVSPFKYILVDEFQDISIGRYRLLKSLIDQNPEQRLYCVGDDWQSIFRFTGADISVMVDFSGHFGFAKRTSLAGTYRFGQPIADISSRFVMKNPNQIPKTITSHRHGEDEPLPCEIRYASDMAQGVEEILRDLNGAAVSRKASVSVGVLGRYRHDEPRGLTSIAARYPSLQVVYNTVHAAKGLEWDYVVLSNVIAGKYGFPTEICDDPILELVLTGDKGAKNPEERRLFYVALTRARRKVFILTDPTCPSVFVKELEAQSGKMTLCPVCKTGFLVERSNGQFIGCDNYPYCTYTSIPGSEPCPKCQIGSLVHRYGKWSRFLGCTNRDCDYTKNDPELCPMAGCTGQVVLRKGPHGNFLGCSKFTETGCRFRRKC